jgi:hypothetical protein
MQMAWLRKFMLLFGGAFSLMSALQLTRFYAQPADIWWTPKVLAVQLSDASDRVRLNVRDADLLEQIRAGRVQLLTETGVSPVTESDVRLRFNNWDRIRAGRVAALISAAIGLGASGVVFLLGLLNWGPKDTSREQDR